MNKAHNTAPVSYKVGDAVVLIVDDDNGHFVGYVAAITEHMMVVMPAHPMVRLVYPKGYQLGSAHWPAWVRPATSPDELALLREYPMLPASRP